jgi:hypothetical protein
VDQSSEGIFQRAEVQENLTFAPCCEHLHDRSGYSYSDRPVVNPVVNIERSGCFGCFPPSAF